MRCLQHLLDIKQVSLFDVTSGQTAANKTMSDSSTTPNQGNVQRSLKSTVKGSSVVKSSGSKHGLSSKSSKAPPIKRAVSVARKSSPEPSRSIGKFKKAPEAPKRFKPAFIFFSAEKHKEIRSQLGENSSAVRVSTAKTKIEGVTKSKRIQQYLFVTLLFWCVYVYEMKERQHFEAYFQNMEKSDT